MSPGLQGRGENEAGKQKLALKKTRRALTNNVGKRRKSDDQEFIREGRLNKKDPLKKQGEEE